MSMSAPLRKRAGRAGWLCMAAPAALAPALADAAGFALLEQSGSGVGIAFAGTATSADDAAAQFFNPAGLALIERPQAALVAHGVNLKDEFEDRGSSLPAAGLGTLPTGVIRDDAGSFIPVGNGYLAWPVDERFSLGVGVNAPFGLEVEYEDFWIGRFQGIRSELITINLNPAVAWRVNEWLALGAGLNFQTADAELTNAVLLAPGVEGRAELDVDDDAWGWNIGGLATLPAGTRIGLSYRSKVDYTLSGDVTVTTLDGTVVPAASGPVRAELEMPDFVVLSVAHPVRPGIELRADVQWTNWSRVDTIVATDPETGAVRDILRFGFDDAWRVAAGVQYEWSERWTFRGGLAWDESPVRDERRTIRLPDDDRWWIALGARWRPTDTLDVDFGYARLFVDDPEVHLTREQVGAPPAFASTVNGVYDSTVGVYSVQLTWSFL